MFLPTKCPYRLNMEINMKKCTLTPNAKINPICHLLALLGAHHILHVSGIRVKKNLGISFIDQAVVYGIF